MQEAAVAAIMAPENTPSILVLKRNENPQDPWSGQYALPGGRRDQEDTDLLATCRREAYEESGIKLAKTNLIKEYPPRYAGRALEFSTPVTAFLFALTSRPAVQLQQSEISSFEWLPLSYAANPANIIRRPMSEHFPDKLYPCLPLTQGYLWGFTFETLMLILRDIVKK